jgi:ribosomal protein S18 acetylase RimI-like enzyme
MTADDDVTIRRATRDDLPALGRLGGHLMRLHHAFDPPRFMAPRGDADDGYAWFLGTQLEQPDVVLFVAERAGSTIGYVYAGLEPLSWKELREAAGFIHDVIVDESQRGMGVGARLIRVAIDWLEAAGAPRVLLWTAERNHAARGLFSELGFRPTMVEMTRERGGGDPAGND